MDLQCMELPGGKQSFSVGFGCGVESESAEHLEIAFHAVAYGGEHVAHDCAVHTSAEHP